jgi:hypothetical protein
VLSEGIGPSLGEPQTDAERHNSTQWINRLPVELLSRIFITGDELDQLDDPCKEDTSDKSDSEFQEIVAVGVAFHLRV